MHDIELEMGFWSFLENTQMTVSSPIGLRLRSRILSAAGPEPRSCREISFFAAPVIRLSETFSDCSAHFSPSRMIPQSPTKPSSPTRSSGAKFTKQVAGDVEDLKSACAVADQGEIFHKFERGERVL